MTRAEKSAAKKLDAEIEQAYYRHGSGIQINIMDIPKIFNDMRADTAAGISLDDAAIKAVAKYRVNA